MHRSWITAFLVLMGLIFSQRPAAGGPSTCPSALSLPRAVEIALRENPSLFSAQSHVEIAEQRVVQGRAGFLPRLSESGLVAAVHGFADARCRTRSRRALWLHRPA